jgi:hypothetical protein
MEGCVRTWLHDCAGLLEAVARVVVPEVQRPVVPAAHGHPVLVDGHGVHGRVVPAEVAQEPGGNREKEGGVLPQCYNGAEGVYSISHTYPHIAPYSTHYSYPPHCRLILTFRLGTATSSRCPQPPR